MELSAHPTGRIQAGSILKAMDIKAALQAMRYCGQPCVTVFFSHVDFRVPIRQDHLVSLSTEVVHTGRSSITIAVEVYSNEPGNNDVIFSTSGYVTLVRVDNDLKPVRDVPPLPSDRTGKGKKFREATRRIEFHRKQKSLTEKLIAEHAGPVEEQINREKPHKKVPLDAVSLIQVNPNLLNPLGTLHGGNALWMIDQAINVCARRFAATPYTLTVAIEGIDFKRPIGLMDNVYLECRVLYAHYSSMVLEAEVSRVDSFGHVKELSHRGHWVAVGLDRDLKPTMVPGIDLQNEALSKNYLFGAIQRRLWRDSGFIP